MQQRPNADHHRGMGEDARMEAEANGGVWI